MRHIFNIFLISLFIFAFSTTSQADDTLVAHWSFEEGSGTDTEDLSGNGNDGILNGAAEWGEGKVGQGLKFTRDGQGFVQIPDSESLDVSEQITISAWIKPTDIYIGDAWQERNCIVAKLRAYYLDINETGNLACYLYNVQPQQWLIGEIDMTKFIGQWVHVAAVYDGSEHRLYINGELDVSESKSGNITVNEEPLTIGWVDNNRYFEGIIDEVQIWSRALDEDELFGLMPVEYQNKLAVSWGRAKGYQK
ncbi:hypothetical protein GF312_12020 [Candidatus Poribacteria bacterium]|nr:hypothetical protein [Candidatus Poribacteria bacterium]